MSHPHSTLRCRRCRQLQPREQFAEIARTDHPSRTRRDAICTTCRENPVRRSDDECRPFPNPDDPTGQTMLVPLTKGRFALIDTIDAELIGQHRWYAMQVNHLWYAITAIGVGAGRMVLMHRMIRADIVIDIDHDNRDGLDNRRRNLRPATKSQNNANRAANAPRSGYKGVRRSSPGGGWTAYIKVMGVHIHLGTFATPEEAARVRDARAVIEFGEFAELNLIPDHDAA